MNWRKILFPSVVEKPAEGKIEPSGGNGGGAEMVFAQAPEKELRSSEQHKYLFDDGVLHWNQHRRDNKFKPNFSGLNFVKEAAKTRLFGRPSDLIGEERVCLAGVDWTHAELQGCTLAKADLRGARLAGADLRNANLSGALLNDADLTAADLRGANLDGAQLARAKLAHASFAGASAKGANFAWTDLTHAIVGARTLSEANVFGAVFAGQARFERRVPPPVPQQHWQAWPNPYQPQAAPAGEPRAA